jgi:hypothetical protein
MAWPSAGHSSARQASSRASFGYTFSISGSTGGGTGSGVYPESQSVLPAYAVKPGPIATVTMTS